MSKGEGSKATLSAGAAAVEYFMRPKSVVIIGMSSKPGSAGHIALANLTNNNYAGDIYLVGRSGGEVEGRKVLASMDELPLGVDLAVFTLPAVGVREAMVACGQRKVKAAVVFAAGFAEVGERAKQDDLAAVARAGGVAMLGPNCLGYTNFVDRFQAGFVSAVPVPKMDFSRDPGIAIISQSGGLMGHVKQALEPRNLPISYTISTGNEAGLGLHDFIEFLTHEPSTRVIIVYVEEVRDQRKFLDAASKAQAAGKPVLMMHPGRGAKAQEAVQSHTGALAGDYAVMRTQVARNGIMLVDTLDELTDVAEILARYPEAPTAGPGVLTFSGAFCALAHDFCEDMGLEIPPLSPHSEAYLKSIMPAFATPRNPLDLTTQPVWQPDLMYHGPKTLLDDPVTGSLVISIPMGNPQQTLVYLEHLIRAMEGSKKPVVFSLLGEHSPVPPETIQLAREKRVIMSRSADRALRAMARITFYGRDVARGKAADPKPVANMPKLPAGPAPEWLGKQAFKAAGIAVPAGDLARSADEAVTIAARIGYPVVMKAQAAKLAHKTEAGGVLLNLADEAAVRAAWTKLHANIEKYSPGMKLDGALIEKMSQKGLELVVGARRDPQWGPVVLVGLGGVMIEALGDVRLMPADLSQPAIVDELRKLKTAKLFDGFRGAPPVDLEAVAKVANTIGDLMRTQPDIVEIDVNPLMVYARGEGVTALDALIVSKG